MLPAFDTASGLPFPVINLAKKKGYHTKDFPGLTSVAEVSTLQLEFRYLSQLTGNDDYWRAAEKVRFVSLCYLNPAHSVYSSIRSCK